MTSAPPSPDLMAPFSVAKVAGRYLVVNTLGNWALFEPDSYHRLLRGTLSPSAVRTLVEEGVLRDRARPAFTKNHVLEALRPHCGGPSLHVIALGAGCNLDCVYCRTSVMRAASPARSPTPDELRRVVEFALSCPLKQQMLEFGVGEPTLRSEVLLDVIAYAERVAEDRGKQVSFRLTTNGTHLDEATVERLVAHDVHISISLDGPADLHDRQRPHADGRRGSFAAAARWIADLCRNRHYPKVSASTTVTGWNVDRLDEIIDLYLDLGVERVALRPVAAQGAATSGGTDLLVRGEALERAVPRALARIVELGAGRTRLHEAYLSFYCQQVFGDRRAMTEAMSPCGFGIGQLAYSPDGWIFGCEEYMSAGLPALGHVTRDTPATIVHHPMVREVLEKSFLDDLACASCAFIPYCGQCPAVAKHQSGSFLPIKSLTFRCTMTRSYLTFIFERAAVGDPALRGYCERYGHGWTQDLSGNRDEPTMVMFIQPPPADADDVPAAVVPNLVAVRHGLREALRYEATETEALALARAADRYGLCAAAGARDRWAPARRFFYLARTAAAIRRLLAIERRDPVEEGALYGYPICCIEAFASSRPWPADAEPNLPLRAWRRTAGAPFSRLNILLWYLDDRRTPYYLISHFPCSFECAASLAYARALEQVLRAERPRLAELLDAYLPRPILLFDRTQGPRDENNGYVFLGRSAGNEIRYSRSHALRTVRALEPFCRGDRLVNEPSRVAVFCGDELVGSVSKGPGVEAHILPFDAGGDLFTRPGSIA